MNSVYSICYGIYDFFRNFSSGLPDWSAYRSNNIGIESMKKAPLFEKLPDEIVLRIFSFLESRDIVLLQVTSRQFLRVGLDNNLWRVKCFEDSRADISRREEQLVARQEPRLAALRTAMSGSSVHGLVGDREDSSSAKGSGPVSRSSKLARAIADWDASYPGESVNFYQEYIQRYAPVVVNWAQTASSKEGGTRQELESLGTAVYQECGTPSKIVSPMEDGSVCIWDTGRCGQLSDRFGRIVARTSNNFLEEAGVAKHSTLSQETGAIENISINSSMSRAYIAVYDHLVELDLAVLKVINRKKFPFPITSLSEARSPTPLTVGTNESIFLYDTRQNHLPIDGNGSTIKCEQIGGAPSANWTLYPRGFSRPSILPQPGPLSILHLQPRSTALVGDINGDIWVGGRFTSMLIYDRRMWPQIRQTIFSGARLSCLCSLPYPYIPRVSNSFFDFERPLSSHELYEAKSIPGTTVLAAGQYKGKGSLELYGLSASHDLCGAKHVYQNRQTASRSRLLYVAPHGTKLVHSDGDGNLKWVERDGKTLVRTFNINDSVSLSKETATKSRGGPWEQLRRVGALFARDIEERGVNDLVQKIIPLTNADDNGREDLLIQTGDGRVGMLEFGCTSSSPYSANSQGISRHETDTEFGEEGREEEEAERVYGARMRQIIESQANHARLLRRLGPGPGSGWGH